MGADGNSTETVVATAVSASANTTAVSVSGTEQSSGGGSQEADSTTPTGGISESRPATETYWTTTTEVVSTGFVPTSTTTASEEELETDSPLDNANFLSFEEWKKQNLAKAGQSPEHVGQQRGSGSNHVRQHPGINNALDVLGEDTEIELDFSGFGGSARQEEERNTQQAAEDTSGRSDVPPTGDVRSAPGLRSKDAGKTCKERTNYASFDCAATVLKTNPGTKSASSILIENKDSYMLNVCSMDNKFFIVELCDDILIDTVVLANYEFFSSIFRTFRVSVSDRYPVKADRWKELGVFEARNSRDVQAFLIEQPLIWAKYMRIELLTHYGNEYYCPVSLLRVHGTTMMEEFRHQEEIARGEDPDESDVEEANPKASEELAQESPENSVFADASVPNSTSILSEKAQSVVVQDREETATPSVDAVTSAATTPGEQSSMELSVSSQSGPENRTTMQFSTETATSSAILTATPSSGQQRQEASRQEASTTLPSSLASSPASSSPNTTSENVHVSSGSSPCSTSAGSPTATLTSEVTSDRNATASNITAPASSTHPTVQPEAETPTNKTSQQTIAASSSPSSVKASQAPSKPPKASGTGGEAAKQATSTSHAPQANPTTQESFFKSIHKRLQMLESNATLSLQYIEEQSRILRDAFTKVEKRQVSKTETFLHNLNTTVIAELQGFRQQYDQLWQSTVIELESHREQHQREMLALSSRLTLLADELVFQKRMVIVQSTLLMMCLGLVLFAKSGNSALELPLLQQVVGRGQAAFRSPYYSPPGSPSPDEGMPVKRRRRRSFWRRSFAGTASEAEVSADERPGTSEGPEINFEPPTPTSEGADSEAEVDVLAEEVDTMHLGGKLPDGDELESDVHVDTVKETQSSPSTPSGSRDQALPSWPDGEMEHTSPVTFA